LNEAAHNEDAALAARILAGMRALNSAALSGSAEACVLESAGWQAWLPRMGVRTFTGEFAEFHTTFWDWYWPLVRAQQAGTQAADASDLLTYLLTWGRGMAKSSTVEWAVIAAGALVSEAVVLYVSATSGLAVTHLNSIRDRIESAQVARHYPQLADPRVGKHGNRYGWRSDMLATASGLTVFAVGLEQDVRGLRVGDLRPTLIVFDDVDSKHDSPDVVKKKETIIAGSILPAGTANTINLFAQNLIHENSVATRIYKRHSELLSQRKESGLIKAFTDDFEIEREGTRYVIKRGAPTWKYFDLRACQKFLDDSGPVEAYAEYQHEFERSKEGLVLKNYRDEIHVITRSEFKRVYGTATIPARWYKYVFHDWAQTKSQYHANVAGKVAVSGQNEPLPGCFFLYDLMSFEAGTAADDVAVRLLESLATDATVRGEPRRWADIIEDELKRSNLELYLKDMTRLMQARRDVLAGVLPGTVSPVIHAQNYQAWRMSHEQAQGALPVYRDVYGLPFEPCNPGGDGGIELLNFHMQVDEHREHPFRPAQMGYTRLFVIVEDDKLAFPHNERPESLTDSDLARYQFRQWRWLEPKLTSTGVVERGPAKMNDDFGNGLMMLFHDNLMRAVPLTKEERIESRLPAELQKAEVLKQRGTPEFIEQYWARQHALMLAQKEETRDEKAEAEAWGRLMGGQPSGYRRFRRNRS
jgi:hypothetical protein